MKRRSFEEMKAIYPDWTGMYLVEGPLPGEEQVVDSEKMAQMQDRGTTTNCIVTRLDQATLDAMKARGEA